MKLGRHLTFDHPIGRQSDVRNWLAGLRLSELNVPGRVPDQHHFVDTTHGFYTKQLALLCQNVDFVLSSCLP
jgi:hypothetical protein